MRGTKKLLIGFFICMALAGGISISQRVQAAENDFIIQDEVSSQESVSDSVIQDRAASASDFVIENGVLTKYTGSGGDVVIPDAVREIRYGAFLDCTSLKSVTIPSDVTNIGFRTFEGCNNLYEINVDEKNSIYSSTGGVLYSKDKSILLIYPTAKSGSFTVPPSVEEIGYEAFRCCTDLSKLTLSNNVSKIGAYDFWNCTSLYEINVDIGNPFYSSEDGIMYNKDKTVLMIFPGGKTKLSAIPTSVTSIGEGAFSTSNLVNITIPNTVTNIGVNAFAVCLGLTHITIPTSVTTIGMQAFAGCENLEELTILNPQTKLFYEGNDGYIVYDILDDGMGPTEFKNPVITIKGYPNSTAQELANHMNNPYRNTTFQFVPLNGTGGNTPRPSITPKPTKPKTPNKGTILKSKNTTYTVTKKGSEVAFTKISSAAASVSIPNTVKIGGINYKVTSISPNAFKGNKKLSKVTIGANITSIGKNAFNGCKNLKTITIKSTKLKSIGQNAFKGIKSTARIKVPKRLKAYKKLLKGKGQGKKVKITR